MFESVEIKAHRLTQKTVDAAYSIKQQRDLANNLAKLKRCTGTLSGTQVIHPTGVTCPYHDQPLPPSNRLRLYVRKDERGAVAKAIEQEAEYQIALDHLDKKRKKLQTAKWHIEQALAALK